MMAVLLDSGFLFASLNASELQHKATIRVLENVREPRCFCQEFVRRRVSLMDPYWTLGETGFVVSD